MDLTTTKVNSKFSRKARFSSQWGWYTLIALVMVLIIRVISLYFNTTALSFDESQYWLWGKEPDFGYFSKPPLLGWIIAIFTNLCGGDSEFCVRLPSPLIHTGTAALIYLTSVKLFDNRTGFWAAIIFATLPGVTLSSILISTDVPLLFCWAGALWAFLRLHTNPNFKNAILLGVFLGVGLMAKYAMAYFFLCAVLFALFEKNARTTVFDTKFLISSLVALAILSPNLWWNAQHNFVTASHTGNNIGWRGGLHVDKAAEFLGSQFGVFGPVLFAFLLATLLQFWRKGWDEKQKFLAFFSLPPLLVVTFQALMSKAYANWAVAAYVGASILVADILINRVPVFWNRLSLSFHMVILSVLSVAVVFSQPGELKLPLAREPFERLQGWREIAVTTEGFLDKNNYSAIIGSSRRLAAELTYYLRQRPEKVFAFRHSKSPQDHYELTRPYRGIPKGPVLLVSTSQTPEQYASFFYTLSLLDTMEFSSGRTKKLWFFKLDGYHESVDEK